jgi:hypothetical protein
MTIKLDPKEVRAHLHRLGYCNVTGEQLKDFIKGKLPIFYRVGGRYCILEPIQISETNANHVHLVCEKLEN